MLIYYLFIFLYSIESTKGSLNLLVDHLISHASFGKIHTHFGHSKLLHDYIQGLMDPYDDKSLIKKSQYIKYISKKDNIQLSTRKINRLYETSQQFLERFLSFYESNMNRIALRWYRILTEKYLFSPSNSMHIDTIKSWIIENFKHDFIDSRMEHALGELLEFINTSMGLKWDLPRLQLSLLHSYKKRFEYFSEYVQEKKESIMDAEYTVRTTYHTQGLFDILFNADWGQLGLFEYHSLWMRANELAKLPILHVSMPKSINKFVGYLHQRSLSEVADKVKKELEKRRKNAIKFYLSEHDSILAELASSKGLYEMCWFMYNEQYFAFLNPELPSSASDLQNYILFLKEHGYISEAIRTKKKFDNLKECSICFRKIGSNSLKLECQHEFDFECISRWYQEKSTRDQRTAPCPLCRLQFTM